MGSSSKWNNKVDNVGVNTWENPWHNFAIILFPLWSYGRQGNDGDMIEHPLITKFNFHFFTPLGVIFPKKFSDIFGYLFIYLLLLFFYWFLGLYQVSGFFVWKGENFLNLCQWKHHAFHLIFFDWFFVWIDFGRLWSMIKHY